MTCRHNAVGNSIGKTCGDCIMNEKWKRLFDEIMFEYVEVLEMLEDEEEE